MIKFEQKFHIPCYNTDASWRLKPAAFMDLAQEAAGLHAVHLGFGYDDLIQTNTAWILSRVHIEFVDMPMWRDHITLTTWHKGAKIYLCKTENLSIIAQLVINAKNSVS